MGQRHFIYPEKKFIQAPQFCRLELIRAFTSFGSFPGKLFDDGMPLRPSQLAYETRVELREPIISSAAADWRNAGLCGVQPPLALPLAMPHEEQRRIMTGGVPEVSLRGPFYTWSRPGIADNG